MPSSKRILVTGGAGFIGSHLVDRLLHDHHEVWVIDDLSHGKVENLSDSAHLIVAGISQISEIPELNNNQTFDIIYHLAAQADITTSLIDPIADAQINIIGTLQVLAWAFHQKNTQFIFASSCAVYGDPEQLPVTESTPVNPISPYGIAKYSSERYIRAFCELRQIPYIIFRFGNVYGPRQASDNEGGVVSIFTDRLLRGEPCAIFGDGHQTRDFVYVHDIVQALVMAQRTKENHLIQLSGQKPISIIELYQKIGQLTNCSTKPNYASPRSGEVKHIYLANQFAHKTLNWQPQYSIDEGLTEVIGFFRK